MPRSIVGVLLTSLAPILLLPFSAAAQIAPATSAAPAATEQDAAARLERLFADSDETSLRNNPIQALFRGDMR